VSAGTITPPDDVQDALNKITLTYLPAMGFAFVAIVLGIWANRHQSHSIVVGLSSLMSVLALACTALAFGVGLYIYLHGISDLISAYSDHNSRTTVPGITVHGSLGLGIYMTGGSIILFLFSVCGFLSGCFARRNDRKTDDY